VTFLLCAAESAETESELAFELLLSFRACPAGASSIFACAASRESDAAAIRWHCPRSAAVSRSRPCVCARVAGNRGAHCGRRRCDAELLSVTLHSLEQLQNLPNDVFAEIADPAMDMALQLAREGSSGA
jgi:hypothetical protein